MAINKAALAAQARRAKRQWVLAIVTIIVPALGWKYPYLGLIVPVVMLTGMVGGFIRGRWVCGNLCPRGSFFDRILLRLSPGRPGPAFLRSMRFRWAFFAVMMTVMVLQASRNPGSLRHWGWVFWLMCTVTTLIAIVLGLFTHARAWCTFCPVGTFARAVSRRCTALRIAEACRRCGSCDKACPMYLSPSQYRNAGLIAAGDCLHCGLCIAACPFEAISPSCPGRSEGPRS